MTRRRIHGEDLPFGRWIRARKDLDSVADGLTVNDADFTIHKYKNNVDGLGPRTVHLMMNIEVKSRNAMPHRSQLQALFFTHQRLNARGSLRDAMCPGSQKSVWHFGVHVLSCPGETPGDDEDEVTWCGFDHDGTLLQRRLRVRDLVRIFRFELRPDTLAPLELRRHHKTRLVEMVEQMPLGFKASTILRKSS